MAVFLLKTLLGVRLPPPPATGIFEDVPVDSFAADWIEDLYDRQITGGCQPETRSCTARTTRTRAARWRCS